MITSISDYYREINRDFLNKAWREGPDIGFELFYKVERMGVRPPFLKFGSYDPKTREKIQKLMAAKDNQTLFIHETDLIKYYNKFLIDNLRKSVEEGEPFEKILVDTYQINRTILQEYFENIGSTRILRNLNEVVEILTLCMTEGKLKAVDVFKTTSKDGTHPGHCSNAGLYNMFFGFQLKMKPSDIRELGLGGMLFDIGKKGIPKSIFEKQGELSPEDWQHIRKHPNAGKKVLNDMKCYSQNILAMAAEHHEKFDGTGYPFGLQGQKISFHAQVSGISDVFNALV